MQLSEQSGPFTAGLEVGSRLESERDATVAPDELLGGKLAPSRGRIIEIEVAAVEPLDDEEMAELPEYDQRQRQFFQLIGAQTESAGFETIVSRGAHDARRTAPVSTHFAFFPQLGQWNPASEVAEDAAEAGGTAFRRMHLQHNGRGNPLHAYVRPGSRRAIGDRVPISMTIRHFRPAMEDGSRLSSSAMWTRWTDTGAADSKAVGSSGR